MAIFFRARSFAAERDEPELVLPCQAKAEARPVGPGGQLRPAAAPAGSVAVPVAAGRAGLTAGPAPLRPACRACQRDLKLAKRQNVPS
jgi:hypothetical protein